MINFKIDNDKCTQCKMCVSVCPVMIINASTEFPEIKEGKEDNCLQCQHCLAVCPEAALSIWDKKPENSISSHSAIPQSEDLANLMQIRRSVRRFQQHEIDKELIYRLISMASYAPTAKNQNAVQFTVVDNLQDMSKLRELAYNQIKIVSEDESLAKEYAFMLNFQKVWEEKKVDVIFRNAPYILFVSAPKKNAMPVIDATIALTYFDLLAQSNGIATLWNGFAKYLFEDIAPVLKEKIGIPQEHEIVMALIFGKPKVNYARSIQNDNPSIKSVKL